MRSTAVAAYRFFLNTNGLCLIKDIPKTIKVDWVKIKFLMCCHFNVIKDHIRIFCDNMLYRKFGKAISVEHTFDIEIHSSLHIRGLHIAARLTEF